MRGVYVFHGLIELFWGSCAQVDLCPFTCEDCHGLLSDATIAACKVSTREAFLSIDVYPSPVTMAIFPFKSGMSASENAIEMISSIASVFLWRK